jgi:hypothetical protein
MARAKAAQAESVAIELPALDIRTMQITIVGDSALICHAWSAKAKRAMLDKQMKKRDKPRRQNLRKMISAIALYPHPAVGYAFPAVAFKSAAVDRCL